MKLGSYFQQTVPVKRKRETSIIVTNEKIKKEFDETLQKRVDEIEQLQKKLDDESRRTIQHTMAYDDILARYNEAMETIETHERLDSTVYSLKQELGTVRIEADKVGNLEHQIKTNRKEFETLELERNTVRQELEKTTKDLEEVQNIVESLKTENEQRNFVISDYEHKYPIAASNYQNAQGELEILQDTIQERNKDVELLSANFFHWKDMAETLEDQLNEEARLRDEIKRSLEILTYENSLDSKRITKSSKAYKEAKEEILNLTNRNLELTNFTEQMSKIIIEQRKSIAAIGMSQASIGAKEDFHIPFAKENIRTKQLGNAQPTLLKFNETNDDND